MVTDDKREEPLQNAAPQEAYPAAPPDLETVFREHSRQVFRSAFRVTGNAQDAEDVVQTVFMRLANRTGASPLGDRAAQYLHRAAVNAGLDVIRSRKAARKTDLGTVEPVLAEPAERSPDAVSSAGEIREHVRHALLKLSPKSAQIFTLRYFEGYDNHEIASMLGTSRSTVAVVLHRCRRRLRESLRPLLGETS